MILHGASGVKMVTRTDGPFHYYSDIYSGVTGDTIRANATDPKQNAAALHSLAEELHKDERGVTRQIEGDIKTAVAKNPKVLVTSARSLGAAGTYAVGLVDLFAADVDTFDTTVNGINTDFHTQMGLALQAYHHEKAFHPDDTSPFDRKGTAAAIKSFLKSRYQKARNTLDARAETIASMFKQGPTPANVRTLIDQGCMPLSAASLYPGLTLTMREIRKALDHDPAFAHIPSPASAAFATWFAALSPWQQELARMKLAETFPPEDFNPYTTIRKGGLPAWAQPNYCFMTDGPTPGQVMFNTPSGAYGYFGGGTIAGPGGAQWPIVMPYLAKDGYVYMTDSGQQRSDGGIMQMDGHDPGWETVATYRGQNQFGSVSTSTKLATIFLIATGQSLETTQTDPAAVTIGPDGTAYAGHDVQKIPEEPQDKAYWDLVTEPAFPKSSEKAAGSAAAMMQIAQAGQAAHNEDSHTSRQWYVDYQVNQDGRTRAIVHTYTAGPSEDGKTLVGSFANSFPDGNDETREIPYLSRVNESDIPMVSMEPDPDVEYSRMGAGQPDGPTPVITEKMNK